MDDTNKKDFRWWEKDKDRAFENAVQALDFLSENDETRRQMNLRFMQMYGNLEVNGLGPTSYYRASSPDRVTLNVCKAAADTVAAKIVKNRPHPTFLTEGGNYSTRRRARLLEKYVDSQFYHCKVNQRAPKVFLDAAVFGTGAFKVFLNRDNEITVERVFPGELFVDPVESLYGEPRNLYQRKYIDRNVLARMFPKFKTEIMDAASPEAGDVTETGRDSLADQVVVCEAWHLPSGKSSGDGKHIICVDTTTLVFEKWDKDHFPFVFLRWSERLRGFWGMGLVEELVGIQVEINRLLVKIQKAFHLMAVPRIFLERGSQVTRAHINNDIGTIVDYTGQKPILEVAPSIHPEVFAHLDRLYQRAFDIAGVSQANLAENMPSGLETGPAVREFKQSDSERFSVISRAYEEMFMEIARQMVELTREKAKSGDLEIVASRDRYTIDKLNFADVDLPEDEYVLKVFPASSLPGDPAGKYAAVMDMAQNQMIDMAEAKRLLDFPDLEGSLALDRASADAIDRLIERMLDDNEYTPPEPFMDHQLALKKVQSAYLKAQNEGVPDERLQLLREFMVATANMMQQAAAAAQPAPMGAPGGGQPQPLPAGPEGAPPTAV